MYVCVFVLQASWRHCRHSSRAKQNLGRARMCIALDEVSNFQKLGLFVVVAGSLVFCLPSHPHRLSSTLINEMHLPQAQAARELCMCMGVCMCVWVYIVRCLNSDYKNKEEEATRQKAPTTSPRGF